MKSNVGGPRPQGRSPRAVTSHLRKVAGTACAGALVAAVVSAQAPPTPVAVVPTTAGADEADPAVQADASLSTVDLLRRGAASSDELARAATLGGRGLLQVGDRARALGGDDASEIPATALAAYQRAAAVIDEAMPGCKLPWELVAALGRVESDHGRYGGSRLAGNGVARPPIVGVALNGSKGTRRVADSDAGLLDGDKRLDRAVGPMQFLPSTWSVVGVDADGDGQRNPQDIDDAALAAGVYLCGAGDSLKSDQGRRAAVLSYNNSQEYADTVLSLMRAYMSADAATYSSPAGSVIAVGTTSGTEAASLLPGAGTSPLATPGPFREQADEVESTIRTIRFGTSGDTEGGPARSGTDIVKIDLDRDPEIVTVPSSGGTGNGGTGHGGNGNGGGIDVPTDPTEPQDPADEPTDGPTQPPTDGPTEEPTSPTEEPAVAPTEEPASPTEEPTVAPTQEPTVAPTEEPTVAPTEEPTETPAPSLGVLLPVAGQVPTAAQVPLCGVASEQELCVDPATEDVYAWGALLGKIDAIDIPAWTGAATTS